SDVYNALPANPDIADYLFYVPLDSWTKVARPNHSNRHRNNNDGGDSGDLIPIEREGKPLGLRLGGLPARPVIQQRLDLAPHLVRCRHERKLLRQLHAELYLVVLLAASPTDEQVFPHTSRLFRRKLVVTVRR